MASSSGATDNTTHSPENASAARGSKRSGPPLSPRDASDAGTSLKAQDSSASSADSKTTFDVLAQYVAMVTENRSVSPYMRNSFVHRAAYRYFDAFDPASPLAPDLFGRDGGNRTTFVDCMERYVTFDDKWLLSIARCIYLAQVRYFGAVAYNARMTYFIKHVPRVYGPDNGLLPMFRYDASTEPCLVCQTCLQQVQDRMDAEYGHGLPPVRVEAARRFCTVNSSARKRVRLDDYTKQQRFYTHVHAAEVAAENLHADCLFRVLVFTPTWSTPKLTRASDNRVFALHRVMRRVVRAYFDTAYGTPLWESAILTLLALRVCEHLSPPTRAFALIVASESMGHVPKALELLLHPWFAPNSSLASARMNAVTAFSYLFAARIGCVASKPVLPFPRFEPEYVDEMPPTIMRNAELLLALFYVDVHVNDAVTSTTRTHAVKELVDMVVHVCGVSVYAADLLHSFGLMPVEQYPGGRRRHAPFFMNRTARADGLRRTAEAVPLLPITNAGVNTLSVVATLFKILFAKLGLRHQLHTRGWVVTPALLFYTRSWDIIGREPTARVTFFDQPKQLPLLLDTLLAQRRIPTRAEMAAFAQCVRQALPHFVNSQIGRWQGMDSLRFFHDLVNHNHHSPVLCFVDQSIHNVIGCVFTATMLAIALETFPVATAIRFTGYGKEIVFPSRMENPVITATIARVFRRCKLQIKAAQMLVWQPGPNQSAMNTATVVSSSSSSSAATTAAGDDDDDADAFVIQDNKDGFEFGEQFVDGYDSGYDSDVVRRAKAAQVDPVTSIAVGSSWVYGAGHDFPWTRVPILHVESWGVGLAASEWIVENFDWLCREVRPGIQSRLSYSDEFVDLPKTIARSNYRKIADRKTSNERGRRLWSTHPEFRSAYDWAQRMIRFSTEWISGFSPYEQEGVLLLKRLGFPTATSRDDEDAKLGIVTTPALQTASSSAAASSSSSADAAAPPPSAELVAARDRAVTAFRTRNRVDMNLLHIITSYL